jgi:hypothetical protein
MQTAANQPRFAVVGHPNKGKSSIVAALAQNDAVAISSRSGTTTRAEAFTVSVADAHYDLIDTPGFQRPTKALAWLQANAATADLRRAAIQRFVYSEDCAAQFPDEVALLRPISEGAAILYVVDGSRPYNPDYEAEMEILRWTGQPSMALINPIESKDYVEVWQQALGQFFKVVRLFNPLLADRLRRDEILEAFAIIAPQWRANIDRVRLAYSEQEQARLRDAAALLDTTLQALCHYRCLAAANSKQEAEAAQDSLSARYFDEVREVEEAAHRRLKELFDYHHLDSQTEALPLDGDLFDTEKWIAWGLDRRQLSFAAGLAGAGTGAAIDAAMAGSSLFLGALSGGLLAGASTWLAANSIATFSLNNTPLGGYEARFGPSKNANFPYVIAGHFLALLDTLRNRTHAQRGTAVVPTIDLKTRLEALENAEKRRVSKYFASLSAQENPEEGMAILLPLIVTDTRV